MKKQPTQLKQKTIDLLQKQRKKNPLFSALIILGIVLILATMFSGCASLLTGDKDTGNVAIIPLVGPIGGSSSLMGSTGVDSTQFISWMDDANKNDLVKFIIIEVNSGGGLPVASSEIARAIKDSKKPTVAWVRDIGASGAYWAASSADHIVANDLSVVGSIGVIGSYLDFSGFLNDHNISYVQQTAGEYKDMGTPFRKMTPTEKDKQQTLLNKMHDIFIKSVAKNRNMSYGAVKMLATGEVYLGIDAKQNGLIDEVGGFPEVQKYIAKELNVSVDTLQTFRYKEDLSLFESLSGMSSNFGEKVGVGIGNSLLTSKDSGMRV